MIGTVTRDGKPIAVAAAVSSASVNLRSVSALIVADKVWPMFAAAALPNVELILNVHDLLEPALTVWPAVVTPRLNVLVHAVAIASQADEVVFPDPRLLPFSSTSVMPSRKFALVGNVPLNVTVTLLIATVPALDAEKVNVARLSDAVRTRDEAVPSAVALNTMLLRSAVITLLFAVDKVMADVAFEVLPKPTTVSESVSFAVSVDVAILKVCVVLSVAPDEEYEETSPFKTKSNEFACGTTTGVAKWKA